jgi:hypothetical protein
MRTTDSQLGYATVPSPGVPKLVLLSGTGGTAKRGSGRRVISISAAAHSTVAIAESTDKDSSAFGACRVNEVYQWGHGNPLPTRVPFSVKNSSGTAGSSSSSSSNSGRISEWQLYSEERIDILQVSAAKYHNAALSTTGQVRITALYYLCSSKWYKYWISSCAVVLLDARASYYSVRSYCTATLCAAPHRTL